MDPWVAQASAENRELTAGAFESLVQMVTEHMNAEEQHVLPIVERHIYAWEWEEMMTEGAKSFTLDQMLLVAGMLMLEGGIESVPEVARAEVAEVAPRIYREHSQRVFGADSAPLGVG